MKNSSKTEIRKGDVIERTEGGITTGYIVEDVRDWLVFAWTLDGKFQTHFDNLEERGVTFRLVQRGQGEVLWTADKIAAYEALPMDERMRRFTDPTGYLSR